MLPAHAMRVQCAPLWKFDSEFNRENSVHRAIGIEIRWYAFIWTLNLLLVSLLLFTFVLYFFQPETNVNRRKNVNVTREKKTITFDIHDSIIYCYKSFYFQNMYRYR